MEIPLVDNVKFLGVVLDKRLAGVIHLRVLISKGYKVANIITCRCMERSPLPATLRLQDGISRCY